MKKVIIIIVLFGALYVLSQMIFSDVKNFAQNATVIVSGMNKNEIDAVVRTYYNQHILESNKTLPEDARIVVTPAHITSDDTLDIVVRVESEYTCGSGGCITTLFSMDSGSLVALPFEYAVKDIIIMESVTNHMHDIRANGNSDTILMWDGNRYSLNNI